MLAIISDTHLPCGPRELPGACLERLRAAEAIIHAGDLSTLSELAQLQALGPPVTAVHGNVDNAATRAALPETVRLGFHGHELAVVHDAGDARGRLRRLRRRFPGAAAVIFGHSHLPLHEADADGFQIVNPGSPTERRRAPRHTMALARADPRRGLVFELVDLDGLADSPVG
jgi:putative phosphoesterase